MKDSQSSGKTIAALLLATDTSVESKNAVNRALNDKNWTGRDAAARAIALRDLREDYAYLVILPDDKRDKAKYAAGTAMIRLKQRTLARPPH